MSDDANKLRLGLVGCSWFALRCHIPALLAPPLSRLVSLTAVCSRTKKSMAKAEARAGLSLKRHAEMRAMFADPEVDAVLLVLPIPLMGAAIEAALRAGKHVISEKPAAHSVEEAARLCEVLRELPEPAPAWYVLENWAHKPAVRWLRERLNEGAIGHRVLRAHCSHHEHVPPAKPDRGRGGSGADPGASADWRASGVVEGGWLVDVGVHWARALRVLLGEPSTCSGSTSLLYPDPARDAAAQPLADSLSGWSRHEFCASAVTISLSFGPGGRVARDAGAECAEPPSLELVGERGTLSWWARDPSGRGGARVALRRAGEAAEAVRLEHDDWVEGGTAAGLADAVTHLSERLGLGRRGGKLPAAAAPCEVGYAEALRDLSLVAALLRSEGAAADPAELLAAPARDGLLLLPPLAVHDACRTRSFVPAVRVGCATEREVGAALRLARARGLVARAVGARHSWSAYGAAPAGLCLELDGMRRVLRVDTTELRVVVEPGVSLRELRRVLASNGLSMGSWPMLLDQTVGGATLGCGSHGSSVTDGTMADQVTRIRLLTHSGAMLELAEGKGSPELLRAARLSLGFLGVATTIELRVVRRYFVRREVHTLRLPEFSARADAMTAHYRHLWALWILGQPELCVCGLEDLGETPAHGATRYDGENWYAPAPAPPFEPPGRRRAAARPATAAAAEPGAEAGAGPGPGVEAAYWVSLQYAFPRATLPSLIELLSRLAGAEPAGGASTCSLAGRQLEIKFVGDGEGRTLLGVNAAGAVVCANVLWRLDAAEREAGGALETLEAALIELGGTAHLGKAHRRHELCPDCAHPAGADGLGLAVAADSDAVDEFARVVAAVGARDEGAEERAT